MKNRVSRVLTAALGVSALALAPGCFLLPGPKYKLDVESAENAAAELQSLYVLVATTSDVQEPLGSESKYEDLLDEERSKKYLSFVHYQPLPDGSWRLVKEIRQSGYVEQEIDERTIEVVVDLDLVEKTRSEYCLVVLAFFGAGGFEQVTVDHAVLDAEGRQVAEVGAGTLVLRDQ